MRNKTHRKPPFGVQTSILLSMLLCLSASAQMTGEELSATNETDTISATGTSDYVSIQVDGGTIRQVLNAFAMQTQRNVVIGPEVVSEDVNIHLNQVRWDEALEVILKPYGYGYRMVGNTIVISELENLASLAAVEPLETRVFDLRFLDAGDVKEMLEGQLSSRGSMSIMQTSGQKGWEFAAQSRMYSRSGATLTKRQRLVDEENSAQAKSKTIIVTDIPSILDSIESVLETIDQIPKQILVEAKFIEVNDNFLRDIGVELGGTVKLGGNPISFQDKFFDASPSAFDPVSTDISGKRTLNTFGQLSFESGGAEFLLNMLQEDDDSNVLSSPRVLTLNNQEATIIVGQKYPIIESDVSGSGGDAITSTTLDYYENIGIQLNVVPQISDEGFINMIVHPSVSSIVGFESGAVSTGGSTDNQALTQYPIINVREAETQILLKDQETTVIGGLLEERDGMTEFKVPLLGDIPFLGALFRRQTSDQRTVDLLIFLSATIVDADSDYMNSSRVEDAEEVFAEEPAIEIVVVASEVETNAPVVEIDVSEAEINAPVVETEAPAASKEEDAVEPEDNAQQVQSVMNDLSS
ncbi:secretin and TonB N-terminal domain-containing protein [Tichowtungia aerotolerans]|uniref:Secretin/TonB short N-terminal domain-containing protein n=1 Tax=Tichowtungia aerotolerans TaxID=2697043 RepID=A0A6P1MFW9_9BACT|nr:secretin and TonB N-terminal domain-containing protein [Tichowtungia aerotolerans]QHI70506.1 hypothetical protein GT409_14015 [Tichowtungia aerotolerans]